MANNTTAFHTISNNALLCSAVLKFIAMIIGVLGNVTIIIYTIISSKEKTATSYLVGNLALADLLVCLTFYPIWIIEFIQIMLNIDNEYRICFVSSNASLLAITVDCYLFIVKPLKYPQIVTHRRMFLVVLGIWTTACCLLFHYISAGWRSYPYVIKFRSLFSITASIYYFSNAFVVYLPLSLILLLNVHILFVVRKQRKRILDETTVNNVENSAENSANRMKFVVSFFVALKPAKTFAIFVAVWTICVLTPTVVGQILDKVCNVPCMQLWFVVLNYEFNGILSIVNAFIYGIRQIKYRKAYLHILFKLFPFLKANN